MTHTKAIAEYTESSEQLFRVVSEYITIMKRLFDQSRQPGFTVANWAPLGELVAVDEFEWAGPFREVLNWRGYLEFLTQWAHTVSWVSTVQRIHAWQRVIYLEHEEKTTIGDTVELSRSISVFEFNDASKIRRLDIYLQRQHSLGL